MLLKPADNVCPKCLLVQKSWRMVRGQVVCQSCFQCGMGVGSLRRRPPEYKKRWKRNKRREQLPWDFRCPVCGIVKIESRRWVVLKHDQIVYIRKHYGNRAIGVLEAKCICKSCFSTDRYSCGPIENSLSDFGGQSLCVKAILENNGIDPMNGEKVAVVTTELETTNDDVPGP